jgi:hypothetical protein
MNVSRPFETESIKKMTNARIIDATITRMVLLWRLLQVGQVTLLSNSL